MPRVQPFRRLLTPLFALLAACGGDPVERSDSPDRRRPNVLLVSLDTLRPDHLGAHGYGRDTSPFLDELAAAGTRFEHAFINTLGTTPSHTTILSSQYQETHAIDYERPEDGSIVPIPPDVVMVQEILREAGYRTIGVTGGGNVHARFGFDRGFDHYDPSARGVRQGMRRLLKALPEQIVEPTFIFYHTYEIHSDYRPPAEYRELFGHFEAQLPPTSQALLEWNERGLDAITDGDLDFLRARYDAGIRFTDDTVRELFDALESRGFFDDYLVVITSDHGEEFGEHGHFLHQGYLYDELLRVPLIVTGSRVPVAVRDELVGSVDIVPTILEHVGIAVPEAMAGRPLLLAMASGGSAGEDAIFAQYGPRRYAVRTADWKLIENTRRSTIELYDLRNDPKEQTDLAPQQPQRVDALARRLEEFRQKRRSPPRDATAIEIDPEHEERLRALGYLGGQ